MQPIRTPEAGVVVENIIAELSRVHGQQIELGKTYNIAPPVATNIEKGIQDQNEFLKKINTKPVRDQVGRVISMGASKTLMKRTGKRDDVYGQRRPEDPHGLEDREYRLRSYESDPLITWDVIDNWAFFEEYYPIFRQIVMAIQAGDRLNLCWNGQVYSTHTDPVTYPNLEDFQAGFLQKAIEEAPDQVMGIKADANDPMGYVIDPIHIGADAGTNGYPSIDALVYHIRQKVIGKHFRRNKNLKAIIGDDLLHEENKHLFGTNFAPTERMARELYLNTQGFGRTEIEQSDKFPERGLFVSALDNLSYYYQRGSLRSKLVDDHNEKGIVHYHYGNQDFIIEELEACGLVHPDAIHLKDPLDGKWKPYHEVWKIQLPVV